MSESVKRFIPEKLYKEIKENIPIPTVDAVVIKNHKVLLLKRATKLGEDYWWLPGGRVNLWEPMELAILRELYEETGISGKITRQLIAKNYFAFGEHSISTPFIISPTNEKIKLGKEHKEYGWFSSDEIKYLHVHPMLLTILSEAGFHQITILASGVFDLIHYGHIQYLKNAKNLGGFNSKLIVLLSNDETALMRKGKKPIIHEDQRAEIVQCLKFVGDVIPIYTEKYPTFSYIIEKIKPDYIAVGYDQDAVLEEATKIVKDKGLNVEIVTIPEYKINNEETINSTIIKQKIMNVGKLEKLQ